MDQAQHHFPLWGTARGATRAIQKRDYIDAGFNVATFLADVAGFWRFRPKWKVSITTKQVERKNLNKQGGKVVKGNTSAGNKLPKGKKTDTTPVSKTRIELAEEFIEKNVKNASPRVHESIKELFGKIPANSKNNVTYRITKNNTSIITATSPGKVPGSKAIYVKYIDAEGNTIKYLKKSFDPAGKLIHVKDKRMISKE